MAELILQGILTCLQPFNILAMLLAVPFGIMVGCLPGFGAATGLVLVLPMTYSMEPATAFVVLTGIYIGAEYGGSISAILINTPGTPAAIMTTLDGNTLARKGKAREALLISNISSFSGGLIGGLMMLFFMPILGKFVLKFGAGEIFVMSAIGLLLVGVISKGNRIKGVISVCFGLMYTFVGADSVSGFSRFDFDVPILIGGLPLIAGLLAMFAIPQMLDIALGPKPETGTIKLANYGVRGNFHLFRHYFSLIYHTQLFNIIRSGLFGLMGIIPGVGPAVSSMISYAAAKKASKHPEEFGKGAVGGIVAPETSNNATVGASLIPVLSLGIPSSPAAALFMGAIFLHGMTPGPNFLIKEANLVYLLIMAVFVCSLVQLLMGAFTIGIFANILKVPPSRLFPSVVAICCIGAYAVRTLDFDIDFFICFGLFSYLLSHLGFNMGAIVLGAFLAPTMESSLIEALNIAPSMGGIIPYFMSRGIAMTMMGMLAIYLFYAFATNIRNSRKDLKVSEAIPINSKPTWHGQRGVDFIIYLVIFILCFIFINMTNAFPPESRIMPIAAFIVVIFCCIVGIIQCLFFDKQYIKQNISSLSCLPWKKLTVISAIFALYIPLIYIIGFYPATIPFIFICSLVINKWHESVITTKVIIRDILYSLIFTVVAQLIFTDLFQSPMPIPEWLEEIIG